jgi:hypothetical protein
MTVVAQIRVCGVTNRQNEAMTSGVVVCCSPISSALSLKPSCRVQGCRGAASMVEGKGSRVAR